MPSWSWVHGEVLTRSSCNIHAAITCDRYGTADHGFMLGRGRAPWLRLLSQQGQGRRQHQERSAQARQLAGPETVLGDARRAGADSRHSARSTPACSTRRAGDQALGAIPAFLRWAWRATTRPSAPRDATSSCLRSWSRPSRCVKCAHSRAGRACTSLSLRSSCCAPHHRQPQPHPSTQLGRRQADFQV